MFGFDLLTVSSLLLLAGNSVTCSVPQAPRISVTPTTHEVVYDFSQSSAALGAMKSSSISPYASGVDMTTGGLREDHPVTKISVQWRTQTYSGLGLVCLYYDHVNINMTLSPKIYIAKEYGKGVCKKTILEHEKQHVKVDREIVNKYAVKIGNAVREAVDSVGAVGPYKVEELPAIQKQLVAHIERAAGLHDLEMAQEMRRRQAGVDSLEEYKRVSKICHDSK